MAPVTRAHTQRRDSELRMMVALREEVYVHVHVHTVHDYVRD